MRPALGRELSHVATGAKQGPGERAPARSRGRCARSRPTPRSGWASPHAARPGAPARRPARKPVRAEAAPWRQEEAECRRGSGNGWASGRGGFGHAHRVLRVAGVLVLAEEVEEVTVPTTSHKLPSKRRLLRALMRRRHSRKPSRSSSRSGGGGSGSCCGGLLSSQPLRQLHLYVRQRPMRGRRRRRERGRQSQRRRTRARGADRRGQRRRDLHIRVESGGRMLAGLVPTLRRWEQPSLARSAAQSMNSTRASRHKSSGGKLAGGNLP